MAFGLLVACSPRCWILLCTEESWGPTEIRESTRTSRSAGSHGDICLRSGNPWSLRKWSALGGDAGDDGFCVDGLSVRVDQRDPAGQLCTENGEDASQAQSTGAAPVASTPTSTSPSSPEATVPPVVAQDLGLLSQGDSDAVRAELTELSFCAPRRFCGGPVMGKRHSIGLRVARSPEPQVADLSLGDALERCPAVHQNLTHSGRCRPLLEGQMRQVLCAGALQSRYTDGLDCAAVSACTSRHERLHRRSVSLHPRSSRTLHACPSLELEVERASTALVSVPPCSREDSRATHRACVGLTSPGAYYCHFSGRAPLHSEFRPCGTPGPMGARRTVQ